MKGLSIVSRQAGTITVLDLRGRITLGESSRDLRTVLEKISAGVPACIALDMAAVTYVDSSGLGSLLVGYKTLTTRGGWMCLLRAPQHVRELLELARLSKVFPLFETEAEAALYAAGLPGQV